MICTIITHICHVASCLALKKDFCDPDLGEPRMKRSKQPKGFLQPTLYQFLFHLKH